MQKIRRLMVLVLTLALMASVIPGAGAVVLNEPIEDTGVIKLLKAIRQLGTIATVMNTAAHPDDEGSNWLAAMSLGEGADCHVVTVTRGQGGQNAIGPEHYNAMGVLRTEELTKALNVLNTTVDFCRYDFDSPCMDFGFSKKWEETEEKWDFDYVLERVSYYIRLYRPQVVVMPFNLVRSQHGHHQSIYIITLRAIEAAADPERYPEHNLPAYQVKKLYEPATAETGTVAIDTGKYDPWYGDTYQRISDYSRGFHACQGMGGTSYPAPGTRWLQLTPDAPTQYPEVRREESLFEGLPYDFREYAALIADEELKDKLLAIQDCYDAVETAFPDNGRVLENVYLMQSAVEDALARLDAAELDAETCTDLRFRLTKKLDQLARAEAAAACVEVLVVPEDMTVAPGQTLDVTVRVHQGTGAELTCEEVELKLPSDAWLVQKGEAEGELGENLTFIQHFTVTAPTDTSYYNAFHRDGIAASVALQGEKRFTVEGTSDGNFAYLPEFSVAVAPEKAAVNMARPLEPTAFSVTVLNNKNGEASGEVSLTVPEGWTVSPASQQVSFEASGESASLSFEVTPDAGVKEGSYKVLASVKSAQGVSDQTVQEIDYQHIDRTYYLFNAEGTVEVFPLEFDADRKIGYIDTTLDTVGQTLQQLGFNVTFLSDDDIRYSDLSQYDTIVTGIRAYMKRDVLKECNGRLLDFARQGGHLVVQYHTSGDGYLPEYAPYPLTVGNPSLEWRVTYEDSPVTVLMEDHPFLNTPNKLDETAWEGWVQERSLYVPMEWDEAYETPIRSGLVEQENREYDGQILTAPYGKGRFTYTALVFFRQVPNLVPGGVKLFANIISQ